MCLVWHFGARVLAYKCAKIWENANLKSHYCFSVQQKYLRSYGIYL